MITPLRCSAALLAAAALLSPSLAPAQSRLGRGSAPAATAPSLLQSIPSPSDFLAGGAPVASAMNEGVAALVNDEIISTYDLRQRMRLLILTSGVQPTQDTLPQIQQEALRSLVDEHLQLQELRRVGKRQKMDLIADDKEVDQEIKGLAQQNNLSPAQLKTSFDTSGVDIDTLRAQIRTQLSWQRLISGLYGGRVRVGEDQISGTLQRISAAASQPQYLIGEIFLDAARVGGMKEAISGADQLVTQLQQGAPFAAVARQFSAAPTAANGGDTGWISPAQTAPEVAKALETLRAGQLSAPIPTSDGVYIILLREKQAASGQTMVGLKQLAIRLDKDATADQVAAATASLSALRTQIHGCGTIDAVASKAPGVVAADLGETEIGDLSGPFKEAAQTLDADQVSAPIRTAVGVHLVVVCSKHASGSRVPSRADVQGRLYSEQLANMSKRYLRDLRNSATIEAR